MNNPKTEEIVEKLREIVGDSYFSRYIVEACVLCDTIDLIEQLQQELVDERYRHDRLQDFCVAQGEELSKIKAQQRWIPVTERLPEEYRRVITFGVDSNVAYYVKTFYGGAFVSEETEKKLYGVTHWMPLPEPPKE